jgi:hypothetical protein
MYKKSEMLPKIRKSLEDGQCLGVAIRNAGMKSYSCLDKWRKRPMIKRYLDACVDRSETRRVNAVIDTLFKTAISGNVAAICFYLKNKAGWKDSPLIDASQHIHNKYVIIRPINARESQEVNVPAR